MERRPPPRQPVKAAAGVLLGVAVLVQALVWGIAHPSGDGGAVLPGLRPMFGTDYAAVLLAAQLGVCWWFRMPRAAAVVVVAAALVDVVFLCADWSGLQFRMGAAASLTAGFGALVLAAGSFSGRFVPGRQAT